MEWRRSPVFAGNMEFWAVEVKRNVRHKFRPLKDKVIHLSQAALGIAENDIGNESAILFVNVGDEKIVLGTLIPQLLPQQQFELVFGKEFELSHNWKGSVFFCGYMADSPSNEYPLFHDGKEDTRPAVYEKSEPEAKPGIPQEAHKAVASKGNHKGEIGGPSKAAYPEGDSEPKSSKKRSLESAIITHGQDKKAKVTTQETDGKQAGNTPATKPNQTPQSGKFGCNSCKRKFDTEKALDSHRKAKHSSQM